MFSMKASLHSGHMMKTSSSYTWRFISSSLQVEISRMSRSISDSSAGASDSAITPSNIDRTFTSTSYLSTPSFMSRPHRWQRVSLMTLT